MSEREWIAALRSHNGRDCQGVSISRNEETILRTICTSHVSFIIIES